MKVGFTGTQVGMKPLQLGKLYNTMKYSGMVEFHHGDCIGADEEAHGLIERPVVIVIHPPLKGDKRAYCMGADFFRRPKEYIARNRDIVDETEILLAAPKGMTEEPRGGTWSTIRYARRLGRPVIIHWPDGTVTAESGNPANGKL